MKNNFKDTLLLAFENGLLNLPDKNERWGFYNAQALPHNSIFESQLICEQGFRPEFLALSKSGLTVVPEFKGDEVFQNAIIFASRVRAVNEQNFKRAWRATSDGGVIVVAGEKNTGIGSLRKWVSARYSIEESFSKYHAVCFWCRKDAAHGENSADEPTQKSGRFSEDWPDKGSLLLASNFDKRIRGKVADFGAGSGFLSAELLQRSDRIDQLDLYEADWHSLEYAKKELARFDQSALGYHWVDVPGEFAKTPYDWIIMNPPFHHGLHASRMADPNLGKAFIQTAASTLVQGGKLLMVANRNLPYEETLTKAFRRHTKLADQNGYKIFEAVK